MTKSSLPKLITLLGPTAVGKTYLSARLADVIGAEVISADSRQVFRGMDIGTGKDMHDYIVAGRTVPVHLVDIADPGTEYSVFNFRKDFNVALRLIEDRSRPAVLCGGTGLYIEAILKGYRLEDVPENAELRAELALKSDTELLEMLASRKPLHNTTDSIDRNRIIRALEISMANAKIPHSEEVSYVDCPVFGLRFERSEIRNRITRRLKERLENGMIREVEGLLENGVPAESLMFYGLEYRYLTMYIKKEISFDIMFSSLNTAIHQFAKRQMTWFRRMEKNGIAIQWLEGENGPDHNLDLILKSLNKPSPASVV
ncbi:MAG: tRNA (adenosine(37)-N6)-dimethylallyltransferase MiaA [Bacteroidales bacterium]|nr:tRNA (adenosine(37)-N6)-dimethylallyltransferase MiaA [Bacteroidales bacterium]